MDKVPIYLLWFFFRIKKHRREETYLDQRFEGMDLDTMLIEVQMLSELLWMITLHRQHTQSLMFLELLP